MLNAMTGVVGVLRALGLLAAVWGGLAAAAWFSGVLPPMPGSSSAQTGSEADEIRSDAARSGRGARPPAAARAPRGKPSQGSGKVASRVPWKSKDSAKSSPTSLSAAKEQARYSACGASVTAPVIAVADWVGDGRDEVAVGCGSEIKLLAARERGSARPVRVATLAPSKAGATAGTLTTHVGQILSADTNGDRLADMVVGFYRTGPDGPRGGAIYRLQADVSGAFGVPERLAPIAATQATAAPLDGVAGADVVAINRTDARGRRKNEVWVFGGGAAISRKARLKAGTSETTAVVADVNRDGHQDIVVGNRDDTSLQIYFGDGTARFSRSTEVALEFAASSLSSGDLDGDGGVDVLVFGEKNFWLPATEGELKPQRLSVPSGLRGARVRDANGDGRIDIVGMLGGEVVLLAQKSSGNFSPAVLFSSRDRSAPVIAFDMGELDGRPGLDLAVLSHAAKRGGPSELVLLAGPLHKSDTGDKPAPLTFASVVESIPDAPLSLSIELPRVR